jgi:hypothetical protein
MHNVQAMEYKGIFTHTHIFASRQDTQQSKVICPHANGFVLAHGMWFNRGQLLPLSMYFYAA